MFLAGARENVYKWYVAVLINHVGQMVQLVAELEVVGAPPAALKECDVFVELIVFAGIKQGEALVVRGGTRSARLRKRGRQHAAVVSRDPHAGGAPIQG